MKNTIITTQNDPISFSVYHEVDGNMYTLSQGEKYRLKIKNSLNDKDEKIKAFDSSESRFDVPSNGLEVGKYYFEISVVSSSGTQTVISPATDENGAPGNILYITERL